jgi:hypothetical protein
MSSRSTTPDSRDPARETAARARSSAKSVHIFEALKKRPNLQERKPPTFVQAIHAKETADYAEGFNWKRRLPAVLFHPDTSVRSLDDTPDLFGAKPNKNVHLRRKVKMYLGNRWNDAEWTISNISRVLTAPKLRHVSCVDFSLGTDANNAPEIVMTLKGGRLQCADKVFWSTRRGEDGQGDLEASGRLLLKTFREQPGLLDLYFLGKQEKHPSFSKLSKLVRELLRDTRAEFLERYQGSLLSALNDSLVDLGTTYRIIFARDFNPETLRAMVYLWHPDALDTFDRHLNTLSVFSDTTKQVPRGGDDLWISTITLSLWRLQSDHESEIHDIETEASQEMIQDARGRSRRGLWYWVTKGTVADTASATTSMASNATGLAAEAGLDFPPKAVPDDRNTTADPGRHLSKIRSLSVSLVMTGDWGRYWTCTVVSKLIDETKAQRYAEKAREIMQMFIHQHYTGRVLVFLLLLGYLCKSLAIECENFIEELDRIMGMDAIVLLNGMPWSKSDVALKKLKRMLWGLEALRIFSDKLERAIGEITHAHQKMRTSLLVGHDIRHRDMTRECERVVEDFERRRDRLGNAYSSIQQRIEQGSKLREGITSVIGVEQNENISMLTWVTIAYLPLAFVAGLFSMDHLIVPLNAGWHTYGWLNVIFVLGTVVFALSLQRVIASFRHVGGRVRAVTALVGDAGADTAVLRRWAAPAENGNAASPAAAGSGGDTGIGRLRGRRPHVDEEAGRAIDGDGEAEGSQ